MSRAVLTLSSPHIRARARRWLNQAPPGTIVEFREPQRTLEQNAKMWAMLTDISIGGKLRGEHWTPDQWKAIFMQSLGHPVEILPSLDGKSWFPASLSSSQLSKGQMVELIECMQAWGAENGIVFHDAEASNEADGVQQQGQE